MVFNLLNLQHNLRTADPHLIGRLRQVRWVQVLILIALPFIDRIQAFRCIRMAMEGPQ